MMRVRRLEPLECLPAWFHDCTNLQRASMAVNCRRCVSLVLMTHRELSGSHCAVLQLYCQDLSPEDYTYTLTDAEVVEIIAGTDAILARGVKDEEDIKKVSRMIWLG